MSPVRAVFFDLDGTLVDTEGLAVDVTREWLAGEGYRLTDEQAQFVVGKTWGLAAEQLVEVLGLPHSPRALEATLVACFRKRTAAGVMPVHGAAAAVKSLHGAYRLFVVSGSPRRDIAHAIESLGIAGCFEAFFGAEDYPRSKPAPDSYLAALAHSGVAPNDVLVFEDSAVGTAAARAAGLAVVAVTGVQRLPEDTRNARWSVTDLSGVDRAWVDARFEELRSR